MTAVPHLLTVWNPLYDEDPIAKHLELLQEFQQEVRDGTRPMAERYVWWGKIRSPNRQPGQGIIGEAAMRTTAAWLRDGQPGECHLYLTDYRSLYVGHLHHLYFEDEFDRGAQEPWVPEYYDAQQVDAWFCLSDIRLLVRDNLPMVARELQQLANPEYGGKPVSLYGGMRDLPMQVHRQREDTFFDEVVGYEGDVIWAEAALDARSRIADRDEDLRDNVIGVENWRALDLKVRTFASTAEHVYRDLRGCNAVDYAPALLTFSKAVERQLRLVLLQLTAHREAAQEYMLPIGNGKPSLDLRRLEGDVTLGTVARALQTVEGRLKQSLVEALAGAPEDRSWFLDRLPHELGRFADLRGDGAHLHIVAARDALEWRNRILGVGCDGILPRLARIARLCRTGRAA